MQSNNNTNFAVVTINCDNLEWIKKNPGMFVNNLLSRINSGETDPWPGYRRWHGDGAPGVQLVYVGNHNHPAVVVVGKNAAGKLLTTIYGDNLSNEEVMKQLNHEVGDSVKRKTKTNKSKKPRQNKETKNGRYRKSRSKRSKDRLR